MPIANFNKVIKVLNIKSAVSLQLTPLEAQSRQLAQWYFAIECLECARAQVTCKLTADFIFKTFITLLKLAIGT